MQFGGFARTPTVAVGQDDAAIAKKTAKPRAVAAAVTFGTAAAFADVVHRDDVDGGGISGKDADADSVIAHALASA